jgi:hypothetical protein
VGARCMVEQIRSKSIEPERSGADEMSPGRALAEAVRLTCIATDGPRLTFDAAERLERAIINAAAVSRVTVHAARQAAVTEFLHRVRLIFPLLGTDADERIEDLLHRLDHQIATELPVLH